MAFQTMQACCHQHGRGAVNNLDEISLVKFGSSKLLKTIHTRWNVLEERVSSVFDVAESAMDGLRSMPHSSPMRNS